MQMLILLKVPLDHNITLSNDTFVHIESVKHSLANKMT